MPLHLAARAASQSKLGAEPDLSEGIADGFLMVFWKFKLVHVTLLVHVQMNWMCYMLARCIHSVQNGLHRYGLGMHRYAIECTYTYD